MPLKRKEASPYFVRAAGEKCLSPLQKGVSTEDMIDWKAITSCLVRGFLSFKDSSRGSQFFPDKASFLSYSKKVYLLGSFFALEDVVKLSAAYLADDRRLLAPSKYEDSKYLLHRLGLAEDTLKMKTISRAKCFETSFQQLVKAKMANAEKCHEIIKHAESILKTLSRHHGKITTGSQKLVDSKFASKVTDHEKEIRKALTVLSVESGKSPLVERLFKKGQNGHLFFDGLCIKCNHSEEGAAGFRSKCSA